MATNSRINSPEINQSGKGGLSDWLTDTVASFWSQFANRAKNLIKTTLHFIQNIFAVVIIQLRIAEHMNENCFDIFSLYNETFFHEGAMKEKPLFFI